LHRRCDLRLRGHAQHGSHHTDHHCALPAHQLILERARARGSRHRRDFIV
jgi:hypothetical protein